MKYGCLAAEWDKPEESQPAWTAASEPPSSATEQFDLGADFNRPWAHVKEIAKLGKPLSCQQAADAIAYDMLTAAIASMPAICVRVAENAAAAVHEAGSGGKASASDEAHQQLQRSVMQVRICHAIWN